MSSNKLITVLFQHADYDRGTGTYPNDIALLKLYLEGRSLTSNIIPVATGSNTFAGQSCTISGWGVTGEHLLSLYYEYKSKYYSLTLTRLDKACILLLSMVYKYCTEVLDLD